MYYKGDKIERPIVNTDFHGYGPAIRKAFARNIPQDRVMCVLDVGTGFGSNVKFLSKHLKDGSEIWTIDSSKEMLEGAIAELAKERLPQGIKVEFLEADVSHLKFNDRVFDLIISVMVLHHIRDLAQAITEMTRVLKKGGLVVLADYAPSAGRSFEFETRHIESDFYDSGEVATNLKRAGITSLESKDTDHWYLITATK